jgi:hypothetical protein
MENLSIKQVIKDMNFYNISTQFLSQDSNNIIQNLIDENLEKKLKINYEPTILIKPCPKCGFLHPILCGKCNKYHFNISFFNNYNLQFIDSQISFTIDREKLKNILIDFISYKVKGISSYEFFIKKNTNLDKDSIDIEGDIKNNNEIINDNNNSRLSNVSTINSSIENSISNDIILNIDSVINNLKGLNNNLNECFMISILQCLIHCKPFISQILKKEPNDLIGITKELYELCKIQALDNYNLNSLTKFKNTLKNIEFCDGKQHDSMEFMRVLLEQINEELNLGQKLPYESLNYDNLSLNESFSIYNNNISQRENSITIINHEI